MTVRSPSRSEPVSALRRIPIEECGEPLVDFLARCPRILLDRPRFDYRRETLLRETAADKLCRAASRLPEGYRLAVIEGWRPIHIQRRMYWTVRDWIAAQHPHWTESGIKRVVDRYTAPIDADVPPPHTTGGAVDLMLADGDGRVLDHTSPFDPFDRRCFDLDAPGLSGCARAVRAILAHALCEAGFTNYPSEFWHWSYGDQGWAYRGGHARAVYGRIEPPGWTPAAEDDVDTPLSSLPASGADRS